MVASTTTTSQAPSDNQSYVRPLPYLVPRSIIQKAAHFSESYWKLDIDSIVFKILDALCRDAGAGNNKKALFVSRLQSSLDSTYFQDLDSFYFGVLGFPRHLSESYNFNPFSNALTVDQWIEVLVKDAKYRARCLDLMSALNHGGSPFGFRMACKAVLAVDCDIFELWKYIDSPAYRSGLLVNGTGVATTPHATAFNLTTGFSVSVKFRSPLFSSGATRILIGKYNPTGNQRSWSLRISSTGFPEIASSNDGTAVVLTTSSADLPTILQGTDIWLRASFNPNNGSNRVAIFAYSVDDGVTWTTLGSTVSSTTTTIFTSTSAVAVGNAADGTIPSNGWIYKANIYSDLVWTTLVSAPNFTNNTSGATSFTDAQGFVWTLTSPATMKPNYSFGRTGYNLRTEVLITPHKTITRQERRNLELVLDRLKPRAAILTIATGLQVNLPVALGLVSADSSYFETDIQVTGASGISNAAAKNYYSTITSSSPASDSTIYYLQDGVQTAARTPAFATGQESYENYDFSSESISTIDSIEYESIVDITADPLTRTVEGTHLVQNAYDIRFGPWTDFDLADSSDNFPGGKYGQSPLTAPALNQDGTAYQFRYVSQAAYVAGQTAIIVAAGGEANATQYRIRLAQASVSAKVSDPFDSISQNVGVSVLSSWYESR
jgi:hypothetical protein